MRASVGTGGVIEQPKTGPFAFIGEVFDTLGKLPQGRTTRLNSASSSEKKAANIR